MTDVATNSDHAGGSEDPDGAGRADADRGEDTGRHARRPVRPPSRRDAGSARHRRVAGTRARPSGSSSALPTGPVGTATTTSTVSAASTAAGTPDAQPTTVLPVAADTARHRAAPAALDPVSPAALDPVSPAALDPVSPTALAPAALDPVGASEPTTALPVARTGERGPLPPGRSRFGGLPVRAALAAVGIACVVALVAILAPGSSTPSVPPLAAPAGVVGTSTPAPSSVPVVPPAATSAPAAASGASVVPVVGALFDSEQGDFADHFDNSGNVGLVEGAAPPRFVANPQTPNRQALLFALGGGGKRTEVLPQGPGTHPVVGDEQYVRYSAILGDDFPTNTSSWQLILQWHHSSDTGSPPLALQVTQGQLMMVSDGSDMEPIGPVSPGEPVNLTMHIRFSENPGEAAVTVWRDGRPTGVTDWHPRAGTMSTQAAYLKMGIYRDPNIRQAGSALVTDLKIGRDPAGIGGIGPRPLS